MSDIVERLRSWRSVHLTQLRHVMESAADEIERLRLTDLEREAIERAADWLYRWQETHGYHSSENGDLATLRSLLERVSFIRDYPEPDNTASKDNGPAANSTPNHRIDIEYVRSLEARLEELRTAADQADAEYRTEIASLRMATARLSAANTWLQEEIKRLRITADEREVLLTVEADASYRAMQRTERVVRGLLERTK